MTADDLGAIYGPRIREARTVAGLTQEQVAEAVGVSQPTISRWEDGDGIPADAMKLRLALVLGVEARDLFPLEGVA